MMNNNPKIDLFLKFYSQSLISSKLTRGLDKGSYINTQLDLSLKTTVLNGSIRLVVLTGNAGDGKTAFIQLIEEEAESKGAEFDNKSDNGTSFNFNSFYFETLYDGSQDFEGKSNDLLLKEFFKAFEGDREPTANIVKIIAINEGKLRDFILNKREYAWLGKQVYRYLEYDNYKMPESIAFINLNNRAIVELNNPNSIFDELLSVILDEEGNKNTWEPCLEENCAYANRCYIKYNIDSFRDQKKGKIVKKRLKELILSIYLKKEKHITMRDIRSLISFILFNKYTCAQLQADIDNGVNLLDRFYYNNAFNMNEMDRMVTILSEVDVADMPLPKLENYLYFLNPQTELAEDLFLKMETGKNPDLVYLENCFLNKPEGTSDNNETRKMNASIFLSSMKRKLFFEGNDKHLDEHFAIDHFSFLPYRYFHKYIQFLSSGIDTGNELRNDLVLSVSKSEKVYNDEIGRDNVCISSNRMKRISAKAFYGFPAADFEVVLPCVGSQSNFIEYFPDHIIFRHIDKTASLEINIDLFEILMRIKEGYVPTSIEVRTFFLNLEMFKRRVLSKRSTTVFLTEDDTNLYEFKKTSSGKLVLSKI